VARVRLLLGVFFFREIGFGPPVFSFPNSKADRLKPILLWDERQAVYGFGNYVFLNLNQVGVRPGHP
jgi:hypothetical protein